MAVALECVLIPLLAASGFGLSWALAMGLWIAVLSVTMSQKLWYSKYGLLIVLDRNGWASFLNRVAPYVVVLLIVG